MPASLSLPFGSGDFLTGRATALGPGSCRCASALCWPSYGCLFCCVPRVVFFRSAHRSLYRNCETPVKMLGSSRIIACITFAQVLARAPRAAPGSREPSRAASRPCGFDPSR